MLKQLFLSGICIPLFLMSSRQMLGVLYDSNYAVPIFIGTSLSIFVLNGLKIITPFDWVRSKIRIIQALVSTVETMSNNIVQTKFTINDSRKSASIVYSRHGSEYILNIPYRKNIRSKVSKYDVILIIVRDGSEMGININQQPGIPYLVSAEDLGGIRIEIRDKIEGHVVKTYTKDQIPNLSEIWEKTS